MFSKQAFKKSSSHLRQIGTLNHSDLDYNYRDISSSSSALMDIFLFLLFSPSFCQCCLTVRCIERFSLILLQTFRVEIRLKSICLGKTGTFEPRTKTTRTKNHKRKWWKEALVCSTLCRESRSKDRYFCHCFIKGENSLFSLQTCNFYRREKKKIKKKVIVAILYFI